jgi:hypothetical protein
VSVSLIAFSLFKGKDSIDFFSLPPVNGHIQKHGILWSDKGKQNWLIPSLRTRQRGENESRV